MKEYQPFAVSNFRTGFDEAVEPWLLPKDGYAIVKNAHLYRGVMEKITGYSIYAKVSYRETIQLSGTIDGANKTFTGTLNHTPSTNNFFGFGTTNSAATASETWIYNGDGTPPIINLASSGGGVGTLNLNTLAISLVFNVAPAQVPGGGNLYNAVTFTYDYLPTLVGDKDIMGIKPYYASDGSVQTMIFDTNRLMKAIDVTSAQIQILNQNDNGTTEIPHEVHQEAITVAPVFDGVVVTVTGTVAGPLVPGSVEFILWNATPAIQCTITDNSHGLLTGVGTTTATGFINYFTGAFTLTFNPAPPANYTLNTSVCVYGDVFTGNYTNFFSTANYQNKMFITNNVDNIRYYDGVCLEYLPANIFQTANKFTYDISKCLHVAINRERLLLLYPTVLGVPLPSTIYWSDNRAPLDFTKGEFAEAPTSEAIRLYSFINSDMVVRFAHSERVFRYTGDAFAPFRWDSTNNIWRTDTNYSDINYDTLFTAVGKSAIIGSDGVNIQRADELIPDFTLENRSLVEGPVISIDQTSIGQCYGERFDDFKEGWLCFPQYTEQGTQNIERSDNVLAFNYLDATYAVYEFPFTCLGFGVVLGYDVWGNNFDTWQNAQYSWASYAEDFNSLVALAGDRNGVVYVMDRSSTRYTEEGTQTPILFDVLSGNFNPFIDQGELVRFGFLDLFVSANTETKLRVQVFANDQLYVGADGNPAGAYYETTLQFIPTDSMSPTTAQKKIWKRLYIGAVAKEHTIRLYQDAADFTSTTQNQPVRIHGLVLWMKPAGRIFN